MKKGKPNHFLELTERDDVLNKNMTHSAFYSFAQQFAPNKRQECRSEAYINYFDTINDIKP